MLIHSASQLLTLAGPPQRGNELGNLGIIPNGAVFWRDASIIAVGDSRDLLASYPDEPHLDASRKVVMPGFVAWRENPT
jgi:imidazolonepropionase-like amidohydrolase